MSDQENELIHLTIDVVSAFVGQNNMRPEDVPALIANVHKAVTGLQAPILAGTFDGDAAQEEPAVEYTPAVTVRKSLGSREHIISMIDGKPYKTLKRHLGQHGLTPAQYRERYKLKPDYPMVAPAYSDVRKAMALKIGLGQKVVGKRAAQTAKTSGPKAVAQPAAPVPAVPADMPSPAKGPAKSVAAKTASAKTSTKTAAKGAAKASGAAPAKRGRRTTAMTPAAVGATE